MKWITTLTLAFLLLCFEAQGQTTYKGVFIGNGAGLTDLTNIILPARIITNKQATPWTNYTNETIEGYLTINPSNTGVGPTALSVTGNTSLDNGLITSDGGGDLTVYGNISTSTGTFTASLFSGSGSSLTALNASQLTTGTTADARLSTNVVLLNSTQTFAGAKAMTNSTNAFTGTFTGNGSGLTNLTASALAIGTVPLSVLPTNLATVSCNIYNGNGGGLTNLNPANLVGNVPLNVLTNHLTNAFGTNFGGMTTNKYYTNTWGGNATVYITFTNLASVNDGLDNIYIFTPGGYIFPAYNIHDRISSATLFPWTVDITIGPGWWFSVTNNDGAVTGIGTNGVAVFY